MAMLPVIWSRCLYLLLTTTIVSASMCGCQHRYALLMDLYTATNGAGWLNRSGWNTTTDCSVDWYGVTCSANDVTSVILTSNNLVGTLPTSWSSMSQMAQLYLYTNSLSGTLPASWGVMGALVDLRLSGNGITGELPSSWSSMRALQTLWLNSNSLSGTLPSNWSTMTRLATLQLNSNTFNSSLPDSWSALANLQGLYIYSNNLNGTLPSSWSSMSQLAQLYLYTNNLSGTLPESWSNMTVMQRLDLSNNSLTGSLPSSWSNMTQMVSLVLHTNTFNDTLPSSWSSMKQMQSLYLANNALNGTLPESWANMTQLAIFNLARNSLTGTLPSSWSAWNGPQLIIGLGNNRLSGTLPSSWSKISQIVTFDVSNNCVSGGIPSSYAFPALTSSGGGFNVCNTKVRGTGRGVASCLGNSWPLYCNWIVSLSESGTTTDDSVTASSTSLSSTVTSTSRHRTASSSRLSMSRSSMSSGGTISLPRSPSCTFASTATNQTSNSLSWSPSSASMTASEFFCDAPPNTTVVSLPPIKSTVLLAGSGSAVGVITATTTTHTRVAALNALLKLAIAGSPLSRSFLQLHAPLALNVSFASTPSVAALSHWSIGNVTTASEAPLVFRTETSNVVPWSGVLVQPPADGWIDPKTPLVTATTFELTFTMVCNGSAMLLITVAVPAPGATVLYAEQVEASGRYSQVASLLAGSASSGSALGRMMAIRSMVLCSADSAVSGGVLDFDLRICAGYSSGDSGAAAAAVAARSAIVSNVVLLLLVACVFGVLVVVWVCHCRTTKIEAARTFCLPSSLLPAWNVIVPSTTSGATLLLARLSTSECRGTDVVLGVVGLVLSVVPCTGFVLLWHAQVREPASWDCVTREVSPDMSWLRLVVRRVCEWRCIDASRSGRDGLAAAWVVLLEYRDLPYGAVDAFVLAAVSCVSVVSGLTTSDAQCRGWSLVVVLVLVVQLVLLVALRPFTTVFSSVYNAVTLVLTILSALSQLVFVWAYSTDEGGLWLVDASSGLSLAVVGVSAVKLLLDVHQLAAAVRRRVAALRTLPSAASRELDSFGLDALLRDDSSEMSALQASQREVIDKKCADSSRSFMSTLDEREELSFPAMYDSQFWDVSGAAVGTALVKGDSDILRVGHEGSIH